MFLNWNNKYFYYLNQQVDHPKLRQLSLSIIFTISNFQTRNHQELFRYRLFSRVYNYKNQQMEPVEKQSQESLIAIEIFKMKKLFKRLENAKVSGSVVSIFIPPKKQISDITTMLLEQTGKASNIKDRTNRNSVIEAQNSARERLKLYKGTPKNGLILFCGLVMEENGTGQRKLMIDFQPFRQVNLSMYFCDSKFHLDELKQELLINQPPFGFIIVDGHGTLYATLQGNAKEILTKFTVELPKKHGRGGQSSVRFARLRVQKRHNYLRKVCQVAAQCFITDNKCNVTGLILAGSADFKNDLNNTQMFDPRLQSKVCGVVDICYGFQNGLNQAIELSQENLQNVKFVKEKQLINKFFDEIAVDSGMVVYGVSDTMKLLESGAIGKVICFEGLQHKRVVFKNKQTGNNVVKYLTPAAASSATLLDGQVELQKIEQQLLSEWLSVHYKDFGAELDLVTDKSPEGTQFSKGFTGLGGFLRYKADMEHLINEVQEWEQEDEEFV